MTRRVAGARGQLGTRAIPAVDRIVAVKILARLKQNSRFCSLVGAKGVHEYLLAVLNARRGMSVP